MRARERFMEGGGRIGLWTRDRGFRLGRSVRVVTMRVVQVGEVKRRSRCAEDFVLGSELFEFTLEALIVRQKSGGMGF